MNKITFDPMGEEVYFEKLENGIEVYLYPTKKSKNFYCTFSTKYGSDVLSYKKNNKTIEVIPGTAHFLEHKIMNFTTNKEFFNRINKLGSMANAYTTYDVTNYNIFGSENILENLSLLFDMVLNPLITKENVESEIGIINEEIDMDKDNINTNLYIKKNRNLFHNNYPIHHILGEKENISKITSSYLKEIYNSFYRPDNMFVIVAGNFNLEETLKFIKDYLSDMKSNKNKIKVSKIKEPDKVKIDIEKVIKEVSDDKIYYSFKMNKKIFKDIDFNELDKYLRIILSSNFSTTSKLYEKYKENNLITNLSTEYKLFDNHLIITIRSNSPDANKFINNIRKDILNIKLDENTFKRKQRRLLSDLILSFENIEDVEYLITNNILLNKKLFNKEYDLIKNLSFKKANLIMKKLDFNNSSVLICTRV